MRMSDADTYEALLTSSEAGQLIGRSGRTVQRMAEAGVLTFVRKLPGPNGAYLFRRATIEAYIKTLTDEVPA